MLKVPARRPIKRLHPRCKRFIDSLQHIPPLKSLLLSDVLVRHYLLRVKLWRTQGLLEGLATERLAEEVLNSVLNNDIGVMVGDLPHPPLPFHEGRGVGGSGETRQRCQPFPVPEICLHIDVMQSRLPELIVTFVKFKLLQRLCNTRGEHLLGLEVWCLGLFPALEAGLAPSLKSIDEGVDVGAVVSARCI